MTLDLFLFITFCSAVGWLFRKPGLVKIKISIAIITIFYFIVFTEGGRSLTGISTLYNIKDGDILGHSINKVYKYEEGLDNYSFGGTGFFINEHDVVTNSHVLYTYGCSAPKIITLGKTYEARPIAATTKWGFFETWFIEPLGPDYGLDMAVLRTNANTNSYFHISSNAVKPGDKVITPNFVDDKSGDFVFEHGYVEEVTEHTIISLIYNRDGNSGSPLFNEKGYLVGVSHSGGAENLVKRRSLSTHKDDLITFLKQQNIPYYTSDKATKPVTSLSIVQIMCKN